MKKSTKNILLAGIISFAIGLALCGIASVFGARRVFAGLVENGDIVGIRAPYAWFQDDFWWNDWHNISWSDWDDFDGILISADRKGEDIAIASGKDIHELEIDCGAAKIVICESEDEKIHLINNSNTKLKYKEHGEELLIRCKGQNNNTGAIELYLPAGMSLSDMEIDLGAGVIDNDVPLKTNRLNVDVGAGMITIKDISAQQAEFSIGAGQMTVGGDSAIGEMSADLAAGQFIYRGSIYGEGEVSVAMGEATLFLNGREEDYTFDVSIGAGSVMLGDRSLSAAVYDGNFGQGEKELTLDCAMGNITVTFENDSEK